MNYQVQNEITFVMTNIDKTGGTEQTKIIALLGPVLNNAEYMEKIKESLNPVADAENFSIADFGQMILRIIDVNKEHCFYKQIAESRMKFLIYAVLYKYFLEYQTDKLNNIPMVDFRMMYLNAIDLVLLVPETIKIEKEDCLNCLGRSINWLGCLAKKSRI